jgi:DNA-binding NtrC family response regulator
MSPSHATTAPGRGRTQDSRDVAPEYAFVIAFSLSEPHRIGEVGFVLGSQPWLLGRGGGREYLYFAKQRPGEPLVPGSSEVCLGGESVSRKHAESWVDDKGRLHIKDVGRRIPMYVNGARMSEAILQHGDVVHFENEVILVVVLRQRVMPALDRVKVIQPFGQKDEAGILGEGPLVWALREALALAAAMPDHVLLRGESGTGKELAAAAIHFLSGRPGRFHAVNAGVSSKDLMESVVFGNLRNYPNPGTLANDGWFRAAHGGTLFLDEIGDCDMALQTALLRVLDAGQFIVLGEAVARVADVRVVGATNRLEAFFRNLARFRSDFRARFETQIVLPPLRDRKEDIPFLIRDFVTERIEKRGESRRFLQEWPSGELYPRMSARLVEYLLCQTLETNARQLRILLKHAVAKTPQGSGTIAMFTEAELANLPTFEPDSEVRASLPPSASASSEERPSRDPKSLTPAEIVAALERNRWVVLATAKDLGISNASMGRLMDRHKIKRPGKN